MKPHADTLVLGLGNPILSDDAVGIRVAEAVDVATRSEPAVEVKWLSVGGLTLMEQMLGYERVVLIDALHRPGGQPGQVHRLTLDELCELSATHNSTNPHDTSLLTALDVARQMGMDLPQEVVIYAVEVANVIDFSEEMSSAVTQAVPTTVDAVLRELSRRKEKVILSGLNKS